MDFTSMTIFLLIFVRTFSFLAAAPFFSLPNIPVLAKLGFGFCLSIIVYLAFPNMRQEVSGGLPGFVLALTREAGLGILLGILVNMIFSGIRNAGQYMDFQMGFSMANTVDPLTGAQVTIVGQFMNYLGLFFFLSIDGHHRLINALVQSYRLFPIMTGSFSFSDRVGIVAAKAAGVMCLLAVQISAPLLAVLIIIDLSLGLVAKAAPQVNVFLLGFPIKILAGLFVLVILIPLLATPLANVFLLMERNMKYLLGG